MDNSGAPSSSWRDASQGRVLRFSRHHIRLSLFWEFMASTFIFFLILGFAISQWVFVLEIPSASTKLSESCYWDINQNLRNTSEIDKMASSAASTIMTILPTLLTFAPFPTAKISALLAFSTGAAFLTSGITLGLSVTTISTLSRDRIVRVRDLCTKATILLYGLDIDPRRSLSETFVTIPTTPSATLPPAAGERTHPPNPPLAHEQANQHADAISALHQLYLLGRTLQEQVPRTDTIPNLTVSEPTEQTHSPDESSNILQELMHRVSRGEGQWSKLAVNGITLAFLVLQGSLFFLLVTFTPFMDDLQILWVCGGHLNSFHVISSWMGITALLTAIIRTFTESSFMKEHEIFHLSSFSSPSPIRLTKCEYCSVVVKPPPAPNLRLSLPFRNPRRIRPAFRTNASRRSLKSQYSHILSIFKLFAQNQYSQHAMVVVLRPSEEMCPNKASWPLGKIIRGYIQALMLVFLTLLFGSSYQGDLFHTAYFVLCFITIIVMSRTYSIYFCRRMEEALSVTIIEYETPVELRAIRKVLVGMPGVLVESVTGGYKYSEGYRLDKNIECRSHDLLATDDSPRILGFLISAVIAVLLAVIAIAYALFGNVLWENPGTPLSPDRGGLEGSIIILIYFALFGYFLCHTILSGFNSINVYDIPATNNLGVHLDSNELELQDV